MTRTLLTAIFLTLFSQTAWGQDFKGTYSVLHWLLLGLVIFLAYRTLRGVVKLFQRHNSILVVCYLVFLPPIALLHALILDIFGKSKAAKEATEIEAEASRQLAVEQAKAAKNK